MIDCPGCGLPLANTAIVCNSCHWERPRDGATKQHDPDWWRCSQTDRGQRCANAGVYSPATRGGGPWFCQAHHPYAAIRGSSGYSHVSADFGALRAAVRTKPVDFEAIAERMALQEETA